MRVLPIDITVGEKYGHALKIHSHSEADMYFDDCVDHRLMILGRVGKSCTRAEAEQLERNDIAYFAGYYDHETRRRVERLFMCEHPYFGSIEKNGPPTPEAAFAIGVELGRKMREK